jgi:PEP-CTERM motif
MVRLAGLVDRAHLAPRALLIALILPIALLSPPQVMANHVHCLVNPYSTSSTTGVNPPTPVNYPSIGVNFFEVGFVIPAPPPSGTPNCLYEISDATQISVTYTLTSTSPGGMSWTTTQVFPYGSGTSNTLSFTGPTNLGGTGSGTLVLDIPPHQSPGAMEFQAPTTLYVELLNPILAGQSFTITGVSGTVTGHHYYLTPEPSTLLMLGSGFLGICGSIRRRQRRSD